MSPSLFGLVGLRRGGGVAAGRATTGPMSPDLHAFVDESTRRFDYLICAATLSVRDLGSSRTTLRNLRARGQRRLHFADESDPRRRKILSAMAELETETVLYVASHRISWRAAVVGP